MLFSKDNATKEASQKLAKLEEQESKAKEELDKKNKELLLTSISSVTAVRDGTCFKDSYCASACCP